MHILWCAPPGIGRRAAAGESLTAGGAAWREGWVGVGRPEAREPLVQEHALREKKKGARKSPSKIPQRRAALLLSFFRNVHPRSCCIGVYVHIYLSGQS